MRVLVAHASKHGSTAEIAERIGEILRSRRLEVDVRPVRAARDLTPYDAVVLGSALYAAHWQRDANAFVTKQADALQRRPVWLFSSGPLDAGATALDLPISPHVAAVTDRIGAREHRTFSGRLLADTPGLDPHALATHPVGDFRDWPRIEAWAVGIADALRSEGPGADVPGADA